MKGEQPPITISCTLAAIKVKSPPLVEFLDRTCKPITSKSQQFNQEDRISIWNKAKRLVNEVIIDSFTSP